MQLSSRADDWDPSAWVPIVANQYNTKWLTLVFLTALVWDFMITIDQSINYFWMARWNLNKIIFLVNRYAAIITTISIILENFALLPAQKFCAVVTRLEICASLLLVICIGVAMVSRVYALWWNASPSVVYSVICLWIIHFGTFAGMMLYAWATAIIASNSPPFTGCLMMPKFTKGWVCFITSISLETLIVTLIVARSYPIVRRRGVKAPFFSLLVEDGLAYYCVVILSQIISLISILVYSPVTAPILGSYPTVAVVGIGCNRLLLRPQRLMMEGAKLHDTFYSDGLQTAAGITNEFGDRNGDSYLGRDLPGERLKMKDMDSSILELGRGANKGHPVSNRELDMLGVDSETKGHSNRF